MLIFNFGLINRRYEFLREKKKKRKKKKKDQSHQLLGRIERTDISYFIIISSPPDI